MKNEDVNFIFVDSVSTETVHSGHLRGGGKNIIQDNKNQNKLLNEINWILESKVNDEKKINLIEDSTIYVNLVKI